MKNVRWMNKYATELPSEPRHPWRTRDLRNNNKRRYAGLNCRVSSWREAGRKASRVLLDFSEPRAKCVTHNRVCHHHSGSSWAAATLWSLNGDRSLFTFIDFYSLIFISSSCLIIRASPPWLMTSEARKYVQNSYVEQKDTSVKWQLRLIRQICDTFRDNFLSAPAVSK